MSYHAKVNQVSVPVVYGTIAFWLGKKADEQNTHRWVCYVRSPDNSDPSYYIEKVVFHLHPSFKNSVRTIYKPPYQIGEAGWGEFELLIKIYFRDDYREPVDIFHQLRLYHTHASNSHSSKKPVVSEFYDEVVFLNPSDKFVKLLNERKRENAKNAPMEEEKYLDDTKESSVSAQEQNLLPYFTKFDDKSQKQLLEDACAYVDNEIETLKKRIQQCDGDILKLHQSLK